MITIYLKQYNKIVRNADVRLFDDLGYDDILWIDLLSPTIKEQKAVENFLEINLQTRQQVEEIESSSKYSETENAIICNSNFFIPNPEAFSIEPVSFIITEGVLVSVRTSEFRTFTESAKRLQMNYRAYSTGYHLLISILEVRIDFDADLVEALAKNIATLSKNMNLSEHIDKETLKQISHMQENTMLIRENIFDRQRILSGILRSERFPNDIYPKLQLMIKDVNSLINHADFSSERLDYRCEVKFKVSCADDFSLRRMKNNPQRFWNGVGCTEEGRFNMLKGQLRILVDFIEFGTTKEAMLFQFSTNKS